MNRIFSATPRAPQRGFLRACWAAAVAIVATAEPVLAATACQTQDCLATCTPNAPAAVSTLISGFPTGFTTPIAFVDPADNLRHRFVATKEGKILTWSGESQSLLATPFLDLTAKISVGSERGLLAMAVEPDYKTTGRFYVYYTRTDGDITVERYERSTGNPDVANAASAAVILRIEHSGASNHNGGQLAFGPDGYLYISTGDGGPQCDDGAGNSGDGQSPGTLLGKILRLDVRGVDLTPAASECGLDASYAVPSDNPYVGQANACNETWALGMRNPFRFTFDRETGDIYVGDVGQNEWEEINLIRATTPAPTNLGWVCREGCQSSATSSGCSNSGCPVDAGGTSCEFPRATGFMDPILCHRNTPWVSIMGGYRYRGQQVPVNAGRYFYGDAGCGQIWATTTDFDESDPAAITSACWLSGSSNYGFGEDHLGELYIVRGSAHVVNCIHNGEGCYWARWGGLFEDGFETENTSRWSSAVP